MIHRMTDGCKNSKLSTFLGIIDSWSHRKIGSNAIAKRKPLARQPCLTPPAMRNCPRVAPANSTCVVLSLQNLRRKRLVGWGNSVFSITERIQEWLTLGYKAAKSVNRMPDSCGAHATRARAVVSISKMLSVICLEEKHLCEGWMHLMVYHWRPRQMAEVRSLQSQLQSANGRVHCHRCQRSWG